MRASRPVLVFERIARTFRLGKWKYFAGYDLEGNRYFELPHPITPGMTKRTIDYKVKREWSDYGFTTMPVQWNAWMRRVRQNPPSLEELQRDVVRQERLKANVAVLDQTYREEKAQLQEEVRQVSLRAPQQAREKQAEKESREAPFPTQSRPSVVPASMAASHPPSQEFGANVPKAVPKEGVFPGIAEDSPERQAMAASLDEAANIKLGKEEKEKQIREGRVEQTKRGEPSKRYADAPGTPADTHQPQAWTPMSRRR